MLGAWRWWLGSVVATALILGGIGCGGRGSLPPAELAALPTARATLQGVGQRLGARLSPADLTRLAARSSRVVAALTPAERSRLGHSSLRFRVDRPVVVEVAVLRTDTPPFWLADRGFREGRRTVHAADGAEFALFARAFPAGAVGLGVNALDRCSSSHYAVFVRSLDPAAGVPNITALGPGPIGSAPAGSTVSPFADVERPFADLPDDIRAGAVVLTRQADRADGALLPFGRAWKTRQPSAPRPDQVVVSFGADPARSLAVSWRTDPSVDRSAACFVPAADLDLMRVGGRGVGTVAVEGTVEPIASDGLLNDPVIHRHKVTATGLQPDTAYAYRVGDGTDAGWSPVFTARTAPASPRDYRFLYLGDAQCELERWGELAHAAWKAWPGAGFMLLAGDLVDRGNERSNWDHLMLRGAGVFDALPLMPAVGNHEYLDKGPEIYRRTFDLPGNGPEGISPNLVYSFEYADAFVAVLDSNLGIYDPAAARLQAEWLDRALGATRATWKFVTFHHPIYASHPSRANPQLGAAWGPIFDKHHVDMVLTGHDHAYLRTHPMRAGRPVADPADGTVYVVSVSGEKFYGQTPHEYTAKGLTRVATYQTIDVEVSGRRLRYRSWTREGREVDSCTIEKAAATPRGPAELAAAIAPADDTGR